METIFIDDFSREVWETTYKHTNDRTINDTFRRVADAIASVEKTDEKRFEWESKFYELLTGFKMTAGGRILANAGTNWRGVTLMNCVGGATRIWTRDGLKFASDLNNQTVEVLTQDGEFSTVTWKSFGSQKLFKIELENSDILYATAGHEWVVTRPSGGKEKVDTKSLLHRRIPLNGIDKYQYKDDNEYRKGIQHGLVFGDGNVYTDFKTGQKYSVVNQFGDSRHLVVDYFDTFWTTYYCGDKEGIYYVKGLPAEYKTFPSLERYSIDYLRGFLAGYIAADGCVDSRGHVMLHCAHRETLEDIRRLAANVGIPSISIRLVREESPFDGSNCPLWKLTFVKKYFQKDDRLVIKNSHKEKMDKSPCSDYVTTVEVVSVTETDRDEEVFCCVEPTTHTFTIESGYVTGNCFVGPKPRYDQDSIEGIFSVLISQVLTLKSEGGWGMNFSFIRPRGAFIYGIGVETPGAVKYMELFNTSSDVITAGSGKKKTKKNQEGKIKIRKGAMMGILDVWHPDIEEFITAKLQDGRLSKFNLSVNCCNEFMEKVKKIALYTELKAKASSEREAQDCQMLINGLEPWDLVFPDTKHLNYKQEWDGDIQAWKAKGYPIKVFKTVSVSALWGLIMQSTYNRNDPGVLFLDRANETHCYYYGGSPVHIAATNPCGEQCLPFGFVCNLGSINLTQFVKPDGTFDFVALRYYVPWAVRLLDNVNDLTGAPLSEYAQSIKNARRIGLGVMGWGSALYMMKIRFGSCEAEVLKAQIMQCLTHAAIEASIDLALEKGSFEGCQPDLHAKAGFFKQISVPDALLERMSKCGIRNSALFSCQPTGNTGVLANVVSGGIEPLFLAEYIRTVIVDGCPEDMLAFTPKYWEGELKETDVFKWTTEGNDKILRGTYKGIVYKIDKNRGLTKEVPCVDYGVRWLRQQKQWDPKADWAVTASSLSVEEHVKDLEGFARWVDSSISKTVNLPNDYPYENFKDLYLRAYQSGVLKGITTYRTGTMMNVLVANKFLVPKTIAPKRPEQVVGELHHFVVDGKKYYVAVGLDDDGSPYEVFTGINQSRGEIYIPKVVKKGCIKKMKRGDYVFIVDGEEEYELTNGHSHDTADALTRSISGGLRHGENIGFIVHQLEKTVGPMLCFSKVLARTLKKYIKDGTKICGEECPDCNSTLIRKEGCSVCPQCGHSKCS